MSTAQSRTAALELAVDLACAQAECLGVDVSTETVLARAEKFDAYIVGPAIAPRTGPVPVTITGPDQPLGNEGDVYVNNAAGEWEPKPIDELHAALHEDRARKVTPGDVYARGRMSR